MKTGFCGTFVISWSQTEIDGLEAAPLQSLNVGAAWAWRGDAVRVDSCPETMQPEHAGGKGSARHQAAHNVRRMVNAAAGKTNILRGNVVADPQTDCGFVITDGAQRYTVTVIDMGPDTLPLLMFQDELPSRDAELWVEHHTLDAMITRKTGRGPVGVICFTPGTRVATPYGPRNVEALREGDQVSTKDNGAQEISWIGSRRMTSTRLSAAPQMRPVRIRAGALGLDRPDQELLVSPEHRMLITGDKARALFNEPEVLVSAKDLIDGSTIQMDMCVPEVTYIHLLLPQHQIVWANGIETESFHPANAALSTLENMDRLRLLAEYPDLDFDPLTYGGFARRNLTSSEAKVLLSEGS
ncbi:MAG: Hint domain-containing protein [Paracoccaceae bacterium]